MQPGGKRWRSSVSPEPLGMHLGSLAGFLPCPIFCWCLLREKHSVLFLRHLECREGEVPGQVTMQRKSWVSELPWEVLPLLKQARAQSICWTKASSPPCISGLWQAYSQWHGLHGILSAAGLQFWIFSPPKSFKRVTSQKMQVQWKFYSPGLCNFYRASSSQADNPIFSCLWLCPPCLTWIWSWCLCMCWLLQMLLRTKKLGGCWRGKRPAAVG